MLGFRQVGANFWASQKWVWATTKRTFSHKTPFWHQTWSRKTLFSRKLVLETHYRVENMFETFLFGTHLKIRGARRNPFSPNCIYEYFYFYWIYEYLFTKVFMYHKNKINIFWGVMKDDLPWFSWLALNEFSTKCIELKYKLHTYKAL